MHAVGVREVKNKLAEYLRLVRRGETVLITDRGRVIAQLRPPPVYLGTLQETEQEALARLEQVGILRRGTGELASVDAPPLPAPTGAETAAEALAAVRADRIGADR